MFISFEGIDGCGKTTQIKQVATYIRDNLAKQLVVTREPGGTETAERIREFVLHQQLDAPLAEALMMNSARYLHVEQLIKPALQAGKWVLSDRFCHSTFAYQYDASVEKLKQLHSLIFDNLYPDLTFLLDISPEEAQKRRQKQAGTASDLFETRPSAFKHQLRANYLEIIADDDSTSCHIIDAAQDQADVTAQIIAIIEKNSP